MSTIMNVADIDAMTTAEKIGQHLHELESAGVPLNMAEYMVRDFANRIYDAAGVTVRVENNGKPEDPVAAATRRVTRAIQIASHHQRADAEEVMAAQEALVAARAAEEQGG